MQPSSDDEHDIEIRSSFGFEEPVVLQFFAAFTPTSPFPAMWASTSGQVFAKGSIPQTTSKSGWPSKAMPPKPADAKAAAKAVAAAATEREGVSEAKEHTTHEERRRKQKSATQRGNILPQIPALAFCRSARVEFAKW